MIFDCSRGISTAILQIDLEFVNGDAAADIKFSDLPAGYDRIWFRFKATSDENVYGGGEQFTYLNMKGRQFPIWTREQGNSAHKYFIENVYLQMFWCIGMFRAALPMHTFSLYVSEPWLFNCWRVGVRQNLPRFNTGVDR